MFRYSDVFNVHFIIDKKNRSSKNTKKNTKISPLGIFGKNIKRFYENSSWNKNTNFWSLQELKKGQGHSIDCHLLHCLDAFLFNAFAALRLRIKAALMPLFVLRASAVERQGEKEAQEKTGHVVGERWEEKEGAAAVEAGTGR